MNINILYYIQFCIGSVWWFDTRIDLFEDKLLYTILQAYIYTH